MFACGEALERSVTGQYCEAFFPGVKGADITYICRAIPQACEGTPDCECLEDNDAFPPLAGSCAGDSTFGLTVDIFAPSPSIERKRLVEASLNCRRGGREASA